MGRSVYDLEAQKRYFAKLKAITIRVKPEYYDHVKEGTKTCGYDSMRRFILDAIDEKIARGK